MSKLGMNLRVTEWATQGGRKYMEDRYAVRFERNDWGQTEFAYFGIFDGHGGAEAAKFTLDHLLEEITKYDEFWSDNDDDICEAIKAGFLDTHQLMWKEVDSWPRTASGFPSTSGTTSSICIIKNSKLYIGHVGDSGIVLGYRDNLNYLSARLLTKDHKPDLPEERMRIERCGGTVLSKAGVKRVVWNRPKFDHKGPVRRSTHIDQIPFLAVARSLGDLWSYDYEHEEFIVSPEPDVSVHPLFPNKDRCLILASDGIWNMVSPDEACQIVHDTEKEVNRCIITQQDVPLNHWVNVSARLVERAIDKWQQRHIRADNASAIIVMIEPLGGSRWVNLQRRKEEYNRRMRGSSGNMASSNDSLSSEYSMSEDESSVCSSCDDDEDLSDIDVLNDVSSTSKDTNKLATRSNLSPRNSFSHHTSSLSSKYDSIAPNSSMSASMSSLHRRGSKSLRDIQDYDEVDGEYSIVAGTGLSPMGPTAVPVVGSEVTIDSSQPRGNDIRLDNGEYDIMERVMMEDNLRKNNCPVSKVTRARVPLLKAQSSFLSFSGYMPESLTLKPAGEPAIGKSNIPLRMAGYCSPKKKETIELRKDIMKNLNNTSFLGGEKKKEIVLESVPVLKKSRQETKDVPYRSILVTKKHKIEIVREYLLDKLKRSAPSRVHPPDRRSREHTLIKFSGGRVEKPCSSKVKKPSHVKIIREYLLNNKSSNNKTSLDLSMKRCASAPQVAISPVESSVLIRKAESITGGLPSHSVLQSRTAVSSADNKSNVSSTNISSVPVVQDAQISSSVTANNKKNTLNSRTNSLANPKSLKLSDSKLRHAVVKKSRRVTPHNTRKTHAIRRFITRTATTPTRSRRSSAGKELSSLLGDMKRELRSRGIKRKASSGTSALGLLAKRLRQ